MTNRTSALRVFGAAVLTLATAAGSYALAAPIHRNHLTFNRPVALPGVSLAAGAYTFDVVESDTADPIVRVSARDRGHVYFTGFTRSIQRPQGEAKDGVATFREVRAGEPAAIAAWYPIGEATGYAFIYSER